MAVTEHAPAIGNIPVVYTTPTSGQEVYPTAQPLPVPEAAAGSSPAESRHYFPRLRRAARTVLRTAGCLVAGIAPGAIGGAVAGAGMASHETVQSIAVLPGVTADGQLVNGAAGRVTFKDLHDYSCFNQLPSDLLTAVVPPEAATRQGGNLDLATVGQNLFTTSKLHINLYGQHLFDIPKYHQNVSVHATITSIDCDNKTLDALAGAFSNSQAAAATIEAPIATALQHEAFQDIEDMALGGGLVSLALGATLLQLYNSYREGKGKDYESFMTRHRRIFIAAALGSIFLSEAVPGGVAMKDSRIRIPASNQAIGPDIVQQVPFLKGASVSSGSLLAYLDNSLENILQEKRHIDEYYTLVQYNIQTTVTAWLQDPHNQAILADKNLVSALMTAGRHCSEPEATAVLPTIMRLLTPMLEFDTGNSDVTPEQPTHAYCVSLLPDPLETDVQAGGYNVYMYGSAGKHDNMVSTMEAESNITITGAGGKPYQPITTFAVTDERALQARYGVSVIGGSSPVISPDSQYDQLRPPYTKLQGTCLSPTDKTVKVPCASEKQQGKAYYLAGQSALKACLADNDKGIMPIAIFNSREQGYPLLNGCKVSVILAGEGTPGFYAYSQASGNMANVIIESSSAGNGQNCDDFRPYQKIVGGAQYIFFLIDPATNKIAYYANLLISDNGNVSISKLQPLPAIQYDHNVVDLFDSYAGTPPSPNGNQVSQPAAC